MRYFTDKTVHFISAIIISHTWIYDQRYVFKCQDKTADV